MVEEKSWQEFRETGLYWLVNQTLHLFGWALVVEVDGKGDVIRCFPARVKFRGFPEDINTTNYRRVSQYMKDNADQLLKESME